MRTYLKTLLMVVLAPAVIIAASAAFTLWIKYAMSLDLLWPVKQAVVFGPSILLVAMPTAWLLNKLEEKR